MYPNLNAEMTRNEIEQKDIALLLKKGATAISLRFNGKRAWLLEEAKQVKNAFFPDLTLDYLFVTKNEISSGKNQE